MDALETIEYRGYTIRIHADESPENPREWDNMCVFHCAHRRYNLGDVQYRDGEEMRDAITDHQAAGDIVYPLYAYEHGAIALSLNTQYPFNCPWDAGQLGFVVIERARLLSEYGKKILTPALKDQAQRLALGEVQTYNQYLNGDVYGYTIDELDESCWGYYGMDAAIEDAQSIIDWSIKRAHTDHLAQLKAWIRAGVPLAYRTPCPTV